VPHYALDIENAIRTLHNHPTAQEVLTYLREHGSKISQATVYNNLNSMCEKGILKRIASNDMIDRFDVPEKHDHLVCPKCGALTDVHVHDLTELIESELGIAVNGYDLRAFALCENCKKEEVK